MIKIELTRNGKTRLLNGISECESLAERFAYRTALMYPAGCIVGGIRAEVIQFDSDEGVKNRALVDIFPTIATTRPEDYSIDRQIYNRR